MRTIQGKVQALKSAIEGKDNCIFVDGKYFAMNWEGAWFKILCERTAEQKLLIAIDQLHFLRTKYPELDLRNTLLLICPEYIDILDEEAGE